jgi:stearoyl-CoA desaturase (delta-9 desaturase)
MTGVGNLIMFKYLIKPNYIWMTLIQVSLPVWIYLAIGAEWYWYAIAFLFYFLYLCIGNNVGMHRFYSHRYFEMHRPIEWFVGWCAFMACLGSPLSYVSIHNIHHKFTDTELDPHGRVRGWRSVLYCYHKHIEPADIVFTKNLTNLMREYTRLHNYYWLWIFGCAGLMYILGGWNVLLFCWLLPASLTLWAVALVLLLQHDTMGPSNTRSYMWFGFGETWHGNHHADASLSDHSLGRGVDWTYEICRILSKSKKQV